MIGLVAVPKGEQVPADVDKCAAAEHDDGVEGQGQHQEETAAVGVLRQLLSRAVAEHECRQRAKPQKECYHCAVQDLVQSSHLYFILSIHSLLN